MSTATIDPTDVRHLFAVPDPDSHAKGRALLTGGDPDDAIWVPSDGDFEAAEQEFLPDDHVDRVAQALISGRHMAASQVQVLYRWKLEGGYAGGKATLGKCVKLSGHVRLGEADYLVWLAADHCRLFGFTEWKLEAALFHELLHVEVEEGKDGGQKRAVRPHDAELFVAELKHYGLWRTDLERVARAVQQLPLFATAAR